MSKLEETFATHIKAVKLPEPEREYRFHKTRRFLFDFCWPAEKIAVEIDGGVWTQGRHTRGTGYSTDCIKQALAVIDGWRLFRFTGPQVNNGTAIGFVEQAFKEMR